MNHSVKVITTFFLFVFFSFSLWAQPAFSAVNCLAPNTIVTPSDKQYCQSELDKLLREQAELEAKFVEQSKKSGTISGDLSKITAEIKALQAKIKSRSVAIATLKVSISEKVSTIENLSEKIEKEHETLAQLLRKTNEFDNSNIVHLLLSDSDISDFYSDIESFATIKESIKDSVDTIRGVKVQTEEEKQSLEKKRDQELDAQAELESARKKTALSEAEKKKLLEVSKQDEAAYKKLAADKKAQAERIRSALFSLAGTSQKIEFGTALEYANKVKSVTGIDPAFLLAIVTQESNLGANVGQCYLTDPVTGSGVGKNTGTPFAKVMKPERDVKPFMDITTKLGFNAFKTAVSCPIAGVLGWGGAMGPAQFIPSTWKIFEARIEKALGHFPNPWAPQDAFMASGMYLTDLGAIGTSVSAQHRAACKYYGIGGATCGYSNSVMKLKASIQADIDILQQ